MILNVKSVVTSSEGNTEIVLTCPECEKETIKMNNFLNRVIK